MRVVFRIGVGRVIQPTPSHIDNIEYAPRCIRELGNDHNVSVDSRTQDNLICPGQRGDHLSHEQIPCPYVITGSNNPIVWAINTARR